MPKPVVNGGVWCSIVNVNNKIDTRCEQKWKRLLSLIGAQWANHTVFMVQKELFFILCDLDGTRFSKINYISKRRKKTTSVVVTYERETVYEQFKQEANRMPHTLGTSFLRHIQWKYSYFLKWVSDVFGPWSLRILLELEKSGRPYAFSQLLLWSTFLNALCAFYKYCFIFTLLKRISNRKSVKKNMQTLRC